LHFYRSRRFILQEINVECGNRANINWEASEIG
jgi:hypothetical protein